MISSLSLQVKGLLVISLLLIFELVFVGCHAALLIAAERESVRQQNAKEIVATAGTLLRDFYDAGDNLAKYSLKKDQDAKTVYQAKCSALLNNSRWIKEQLKIGSKQYQLFDKIEKNLTANLKMFAQMRQLGESDSELAVAQFGLKLKTKMRLELLGLSGDLVEFLNAEKQIESASPVAIKLQRERTRWLLAGGMILNIIVAVLLVRWFLHSITSRLEIVKDNAERLRQRKSLRLPISGDDEIASIDEAFHEMSHSLQGQEKLLLASTDQVQTIIDQMPIGLVVVAEPGNIDSAKNDSAQIEYANSALERMLEYKTGELVATSLGKLFTTAGARAEPLTDTTMIDGTIELLAQKKSGLQLPVEFSVSDVSFENMSRRLGTVIDISERREIEKMKEAFVAMVSHDLRTPLTSVAGFLHMLPLGIYGQFSSVVVSETAVAEKQVEELITLINDLLDLEKLKAGQLEMRSTNSNLEDLLDAAIESCAELGEERGVSLLFEGCSAPVMVQADGDRLKQAIEKVMVSAIRLSPTGSAVNINVTIETVDSGDRVALIDLRIGQGIDRRISRVQKADEWLETIFEPFQAASLTAASGGKSKRSSLGLALPLAKAILLSFGGECGVEQDEQGLVLWLQLPVA